MGVLVVGAKEDLVEMAKDQKEQLHDRQDLLQLQEHMMTP